MPRCYLVKKNAARYLEYSGERKTSPPKSPTEATTAPNSPNYYRTLDRSITMANGYINDYIPYSQDNSVIRRAPVVASHDGGIPIFQERSAEEREAAHDLLELSRSLPPMPSPVIVRVTPKYEEYAERKYSRSYEESPEDSQVPYYEVSENFRNDYSDVSNSKPHIPVSVVVRVPSCVQSKSTRALEKSVPTFMTYESPTYEDEVPSVICDNQKPEITRRLSEESLEELQNKDYSREFSTYPEKTLPSLLPLVSHHSYRDETTPSVICGTQCPRHQIEIENNLSNEPPMIPYEEASIMSYEQSLSSAPADRSYEVTYDEDPIVIAMTPPTPEMPHVITRPIPTKVISMTQDPSVPTHVVHFSHIVPNTSYIEERSQPTVIEPVYSVPCGSLLPPVTYSEPESGTNFVSHTPVIRYHPSSDTSNLEYSARAENRTENRLGNRTENIVKPLTSEYHSDAENNNPNSNLISDLNSEMNPHLNADLNSHHSHHSHLSSDLNSHHPHLSSDLNSHHQHLSSDLNSHHPHLSSDLNSHHPHLSSDLNSHHPHLSSDLNSHHPHLNSDLNSHHPHLNSDLNSHLNSDLNSHLNSDLNSHLNSDLNSHLNSDLNSHLNANLNSDLNENLNSHLNSDLNANLNSDLNSHLNSDLNSHLNSELNSHLNSDLNSHLNASLNPDLSSNLNSDLNSDLNPDPNSDLNPNLNPDPNSNLKSDLNSNPNSDLNSNQNSNTNSNQNSNPTPKKKTKAKARSPRTVSSKKKRTRASFLPTDWKRKKTNPSEDTENSGKRKYSCTQCGKKYATSSNLSRHKQTHRSLDSQSAKKCMTCGKAYVSMPALAMHLLTHKLSHACGICGKMFSRPWLLQGHLRSHTGEKPYRCGNCGKAFADRSNLRAHMQTHSFEKNYICLKCKKSFALKSYLSKHLESSCLKENNDIETKAGMESPTNSMDTIDVETWSKDGDVDDPAPVEVETDESMDEIEVV